MENFDVEKVFVTPEMAKQILAESNYERQRPFRKGWSDYISNEISAGRFSLNTLAFCQNGSGKKYLVNGQHTLTAIVNSNIGLHLPVVTIQTDTPQEVDQNYTKLDIQRKRTIADVLRALGLEEELGISSRSLNHYASAAKIILFGFSGGGTQLSMIPTA